MTRFSALFLSTRILHVSCSRASQSVWQKAEDLRKLRNDYDVAHYTRGWEELENGEKHLGFALTVACEINKAYITWLIANQETEDE
jgi:hypothetical protein